MPKAGLVGAGGCCAIFVLDDPFCQRLHRLLGQERFSHSCGVAAVARDLAPVWGIDPEKAHLAGWLHDYARSAGSEELLTAAREYGLSIDAIERAVPVLLHGEVGAARVRRDRLSFDTEVLAAIRHHVTGAADMGPLSRLIFVADMIEPGRSFPGVEALRRMAGHDAGQALTAALNSKIRYLLSTSSLIHPRIIEAYNAFGHTDMKH